jgi:hypothetical protein
LSVDEDVVEVLDDLSEDDDEVDLSDEDEVDDVADVDLSEDEADAAAVDLLSERLSVR